MTINRKIFFDRYRAEVDPNRCLSQQEVNDMSTFLNMVEKHIAAFTIPQWAYVFATVFHETRATFAPVREAFWLSEAWRRKHLWYWPLYGRGYVQITLKDNYRYYSGPLDIDLVKDPDKVMIPEVAFFILLDGFMYGRFRRRRNGQPYKISDFINDRCTDYTNARECINGRLDDAESIASVARTFNSILRSSFIR